MSQRKHARSTNLPPTEVRRGWCAIKLTLRVPLLVAESRCPLFPFELVQVADVTGLKTPHVEMDRLLPPRITVWNPGEKVGKKPVAFLNRRLK